MLRLTGAEIQDSTIADLLKTVLADPRHSHLSEKPFFVVLNGKLMKSGDYGNTVLCESDVITIMPFMAGG